MFFMRVHVLMRNILSTNTYNGNSSKIKTVTAPAIRVSFAGISSSVPLWNINYYESLGIPKSSTQTEIKAAYYQLSKLHHPDRNKGSETAAKKFREISQAYEVLGNYRLRRLYDKGIIHTADAKYAHSATEADDIELEVEDDEETKFYKSRFTKSTVKTTEGRTPIYNFDEWSRAHYGNTFERRKKAKAKWDRTEAKKINDGLFAQNETIFFALIFILVCTVGMYSIESAYDTPEKRTSQKENLQNRNKPHDV